MRGLLSVLLLLAIVSVCQGEVGQVCTSKDQCAADECCEIINIVVASRKRQALLQPIRPVSESGTCKKYQEKGTYCQSFDVLNGFCGCGQGLTCQSVNIGTLTPCAGLPISPLSQAWFCIVLPGTLNGVNVEHLHASLYVI
ncbi:uncharacterized protein LOC112562278 [Pomacea canaliculata]|uniref:uncharacterized protein LOC112562278 n=1 Tax=Pomacea canaliculata TaxID=400727 RepID=UPI000D73520E|nr:uncharacterized protein LOC112562278 [Pomacea canaliculata]